MKVLKSYEDFSSEPVNTNPGPYDPAKSVTGGQPEIPSLDMGYPEDLDDESDEVEFHLDPEDEEDDDYPLEPEDDEPIEEGKDPYEITSKDTMRIQDIHDKANGDEMKMKKLAGTMCKLITDAAKATRRALAAERLKFYDLADMFFARARELGGA